MNDDDKTREQLIKELIEVRKQAGESQGREDKIIDIQASPEAVVVSDIKGTITVVSERACELYGCEDNRELLGTSAFELIDPKVSESAILSFKKALEEGSVKNVEYTLIKKDGTRYLAELNAILIKDTNGQPKGFITTIRDTTKRKQAEKALLESEERYRSVVENSHDGILIVDDAYRFIYVNDEMCQILEYSKEEIVGKDFRDFLDDESKILVADRYIRRQRGEKVPPRYEFNVVRKDGEIRRVEISATVIKDSEGRVKTVAQILDISERKKVEQALRESEMKYKSLTENVNMAIYRNTIGPKGKFIEVNPALIKMFGYKNKEEFLSISVADLYQDPEDRKSFNEKMLRDGYAKNEELRLLRKDGTSFTGSISAVVVKDKNGRSEYFDGIIDDITERKRTEQIQLVLFNISNAVNKITDLDELFEVIRKYLSTIVDTTNFYIAIYNEEDYTISLPYFVDEKDKFTVLPAGKTLTSYVIRSGKPLFARDDEIRKMAQDGKLELEIIGAPSKVWLGVPLVVGNEVIGALVVQSYTDPNLYNEKDLGILKFVSGQIGTAIERRLAQDELKKSLEKLLRTLEGTVNALASTTEKRDPYTAGHQQRVTQLACAIAKEMKLSEEQIEGIRVAGILHDIGKIYVAAEILNKPIRLNNYEMTLVRTHAQVGYDILKTVEFPFPVAQVVLQHHERLDGSGYPQGLKGEEVLLESKILAVSDVVEAMCSHRPYRPAHGTDKALAEISEQRGILYDPAVADTCIKLFREGKFKFE